MSKGELFNATLMPDDDWWHVLWPDPSRVVKDVGIIKDMEVVDLCCGDGYFTKPICDAVNPGQVYAIDMDTNLLARAEKACFPSSNFKLICGDALDLPQLVNGKVDYVFMANTFHGVPDQLFLSMAINKVLKDGGRFSVINWNRVPREDTPVLDQPRGPEFNLRMKPEEVQSVVEPAGFVLDKMVDVGPFHYAAIFYKITH